MTSRLNLAHHVRRLRGTRSQASVAKAAGLDQATIAHVEHALHGVGLDTLDRLASALEVEAHTLIAPVKEMP